MIEIIRCSCGIRTGPVRHISSSKRPGPFLFFFLVWYEYRLVSSLRHVGSSTNENSISLWPKTALHRMPWRVQCTFAGFLISRLVYTRERERERESVLLLQGPGKVPAMKCEDEDVGGGMQKMRSAAPRSFTARPWCGRRHAVRALDPVARAPLTQLLGSGGSRIWHRVCLIKIFVCNSAKSI